MARFDATSAVILVALLLSAHTSFSAPFPSPNLLLSARTNNHHNECDVVAYKPYPHTNSRTTFVTFE